MGEMNKASTRPSRDKGKANLSRTPTSGILFRCNECHFGSTTYRGLRNTNANLSVLWKGITWWIWFRALFYPPSCTFYVLRELMDEALQKLVIYQPGNLQTLVK